MFTFTPTPGHVEQKYKAHTMPLISTKKDRKTQLSTGLNNWNKTSQNLKPDCFPNNEQHWPDINDYNYFFM